MSSTWVSTGQARGTGADSVAPTPVKLRKTNMYGATKRESPTHARRRVLQVGRVRTSWPLATSKMKTSPPSAVPAATRPPPGSNATALATPSGRVRDSRGTPSRRSTTTRVPFPWTLPIHRPSADTATSATPAPISSRWGHAIDGTRQSRIRPSATRRWSSSSQAASAGPAGSDATSAPRSSATTSTPPRVPAMATRCSDRARAWIPGRSVWRRSTSSPSPSTTTTSPASVPTATRCPFGPTARADGGPPWPSIRSQMRAGSAREETVFGNASRPAQAAMGVPSGR